MGSTSGHEITHPITVILDGPTSYHAWSQNMTVFLKGRRLWRYVTGDIPKPVPGPITDSDSSDGDSVAEVVVQVDDFEARLEEWESIQCRILSWFINTSVPAISSLLPRLETGQAAWSFLATRYNCTYDFALEFHIEVKLYQMRQESGHSISDYYSQTASMWEQLAAADPPLRYAEDIDLFAKYKDRRRFTQFMMGLREAFEPTRAVLLSRSPLPSLDAAVKELISEENRCPHHHLSSSDVVLATPRPPSSSDQHRICTYCKKPGHDITECYRKKKDDKRKQHQSRGIFPRPQAATVSSAPVDDPVVTVSQLESMFHRYMSQPSPALSVTSGTISSPDLTIPNTYLVPKLSLNLLSVSQLCELGLDLHFSNRGVDVQDPLTGKLLGTGRKIGRLFELCNLQIPSHMVSSSVAATTTLSPDLWHSRLGHTSLSRLQLLASQGHLGSTIPLFEYSVVFVSSLFLPMNETNLNQGLGCVVFLAMVSLKRVFVAMIPYLVAFVSPVMLNFGNIRLFLVVQHFPFISSSMTPIFTDPSIDLYPDPVRDSALPPSSSDVPSLVLSPAAGSGDSNPAPSAPSESPIDIRRSTRQAMADELDALHKTHTWDMTTLPPGKSAVGCKWVYKIKTRADGSVERYKARLVARGFTQEYGIDYEETFAPVACLTSVRSLLAIAAVHHWPLFQMDVKNAFLNGDLLEEVYMQPPPGYPESQNQVCRLRRALYGLKQAPRAWFAKFSSVVALNRVSSLVPMIQLSSFVIHLLQFLSQQFEMKDLGTLSYFLGLEVTSSSDGYYLYQAKYAFDLLSKAGLTNSKTVSTPFPKLNVSSSMVSLLMFMSVCSTIIAVLHSLHADTLSWSFFDTSLLRYIKGTGDSSLMVSTSSTQSSLELRAYADADWAGDALPLIVALPPIQDTRFLLVLHRVFLTRNSCSRAGMERGPSCRRGTPDRQNLWLRILGKLLKRTDMGARTKHIEIDCHFIRHHLQQSALHLLSVSSEDQRANVFTKSHPPGRLRDLVSKLKMASSSPPCV
uniref:Reverse transcriptase Ty1/copia-type domain-containing protein n=1 Tax=Fagus sylvatica TaxID=28930 RepID=A0A2N9ECI9_FAGSY